jgi:hypothetical protein
MDVYLNSYKLFLLIPAMEKNEGMYGYLQGKGAMLCHAREQRLLNVGGPNYFAC